MATLVLNSAKKSKWFWKCIGGHGGGFDGNDSFDCGESSADKIHLVPAKMLVEIVITRIARKSSPVMQAILEVVESTMF